MAYENLENYAKSFQNILEIPPFSNEDKIIEIKETRNLIVHNNLIVNRLYLSKCKQTAIRADEKALGKPLPFDKKYAVDSLTILNGIMKDDVYDKLENKYKENTKIKAMKEVWDELFNSPVLKFDDYWEYNSQGELTGFIKDNFRDLFKNCYSHTEKILMAMIMY